MKKRLVFQTTRDTSHPRPLVSSSVSPIPPTSVLNHKTTELPRPLRPSLTHTHQPPPRTVLCYKPGHKYKGTSRHTPKFMGKKKRPYVHPPIASFSLPVGRPISLCSKSYYASRKIPQTPSHSSLIMEKQPLVSPFYTNIHTLSHSNKTGLYRHRPRSAAIIFSKQGLSSLSSSATTIVNIISTAVSYMTTIRIAPVTLNSKKKIVCISPHLQP